ncbi:DUF4179 domain-containing protein [Clostridium fungisolvens]|uniref:DUF4179 domain-containing protein n=1 Tax=Clostridium fungisolvens TaxID=1604897 RepID=A0A6V8SNA6_9CLOT|nr:DUF4179 domain-containing protein [Clostridium fungisolvens]GFP76668.1 hypothetical protein bsdtw1_02771 [Clostridium fungisolvens]
MGKDIYEEFDSIYFDQTEFEKIEDSLSEIEIKKLNKTLKKRIFKNNKKYIKVASIASITLIIGTSIMTPAFAKTIVQYIPAMESLYGRLGYYSEYKDFSQYIGESKEDKGYKFTIDKLVADQDTVLVALRISKPGLNAKQTESNNKVDFVMSADLTGIDRGAISGGYVDQRIVDENTSVILLENEAAVGKVLPKRFNMNVNIHSTFDEEVKVNFQLPVSREKIEQDTIVKENLGISEIKKEFRVNINEIKASPLNINIKYSIDKDNDERNFVNFYCYDDKGNIYLDMGGISDGGNEKVGKLSPIQKGARKLYIVPYISQVINEDEESSHNDLGFADKLFDINTTREFDFKKYGKVNVYKIVRSSSTIKFYFTIEGTEKSLKIQDIIHLNENNGDKQEDKITVSRNNIKMYKPDLNNPNDYCIEFTNIDSSKSYQYSVGWFPISKILEGDTIEVNLVSKIN